MHEGGHGIYEMNVDESLVDMLVGSGSHGAMHESSSRFWENIVGRSLPFWSLRHRFSAVRPDWMA